MSQLLHEMEKYKNHISMKQNWNIESITRNMRLIGKSLTEESSNISCILKAT